MTKTQLVYDSANDNSIDGDRLVDGSISGIKLKTEFVSVKDFGAVGDSSNNDTAAIQAALNAGAGKTVFFPKTSAGYKITAPISIPLNTSIYAEPGSYIDLSDNISGLSATANGVFYTTGGGLGPSLGGGIAAQVSRGDLTITCNSTVSGLSPGDLITIQNIADFSYSPYRPYYRQGEFQVVRSVSGNTITLADPAIDTYSDLANIRVKRVTSTRCTISGLRFLGGESNTYNYACLTVNFGQNVVVEGLSAINPSSKLVSMRQCYASEVRNCESLKSTVDALSVESNGVILSCCQSTWVNNCRLYASYHAVSITSGLPENIVSRFCGVSECDLSSNTLWAVDFGHCAVEYCKVVNSRVSGGIQLSGNYDVIDGNVLIEKDGVAVTGFVVFTETKRLNSTISNNYFYVDNYTVLSCGNVNYDAFNSDTEAGLIRIENNTIEDPSGNKTYFDFINRGCTGAQNISIVNNVQLKPPAGTSTLMRAIVDSGSIYGTLTISNNRLSNGRLSVVTSGWTNLYLNSNIVTNLSNTAASLFFGGGNNGIAEVADNTVIGYGDQNRILGNPSAPLSRVTLSNNAIIDGVAAYCINVGYADSIISSRNSFGNSADAQVPLRVVSSPNTKISDDSYYSQASFPEFPSNGTGLKSAEFQLNLTESLTTPATSFQIYTVPTGLKLYVKAAVCAAASSISATNSNYFGLGVNSAGRRVSFGVSTTAASGGAYSSGTSSSYLTSPAAANQELIAGEALSLISTDSNISTAGLGSNFGGPGQAMNLSLDCQMVGR